MVALWTPGCPLDSVHLISTSDVVHEATNSTNDSLHTQGPGPVGWVQTGETPVALAERCYYCTLFFFFFKHVLIHHSKPNAHAPSNRQAAGERPFAS